MIAAGTDYAIFILGRYHEARHVGQDRVAAFGTMYHGTAHIILGSGLTIAGAVFCLHFTRLPYFQTMAIPAATGVLVALVAALTLAPAVLSIGRHFGLFEPARPMRTRGWRRIGTAIVRWPGPILVATIAIALIGLLALPGYQTSYDNRPYMPADSPANMGYAAAERHFSAARLNPELLMIEADHDLRNPTDMILLERVAKAVFHTDGIAQVQSITRPLGTPLDHTSIPFQISAGNSAQIKNLPYQQARAADLLKQVDVINKSIDILRQQFALQQQSGAVTDEQTKAFQQTVVTAQDLRDKIANFDDFFRPLRNYFYWEPHCFDIPVCAALRSLFDALDGIDALTDQLGDVSASITKLDALQPKLLALIPPQIASQQTNRDLTMTNYATTSGINDQTAAALQNSTALGQAYDASKTDDSFYLPPEVFTNPEFLRGLKLFLSPDGHAARMIITHDVDPATPQGISHIDAIRHAAEEAVKGTPLAGSKIYLAGTAATYKDIQEGAKYDLMIAGIAALSLILLIMMFITRSLVAAFVIVGTVALSLGASFGLSVLIWQDILGIQLFWIVLALAVILLLAVGSDYNLLLISRFKEEIGAGLNTGIIRAMAGSGSVVTAAGLVFAATMASFVFADLADSRSDRDHDRPRSAVRHTDRAFVHDAVHRSTARALVLVATKGAPPPRQPDASALRITPSGSSTASVGRRGPSGHLRINATHSTMMVENRMRLAASAFGAARRRRAHQMARAPSRKPPADAPSTVRPCAAERRCSWRSTWGSPRRTFERRGRRHLYAACRDSRPRKRIPW